MPPIVNVALYKTRCLTAIQENPAKKSNFMIERPKAGEHLVLHPYLSISFEIPVFFEPLDTEAIEHVGRENVRTAIVLDGDGPVGRQWIADARRKFHMLEGNTKRFGQHPYYYACRDHNGVGHQIQYLVFTQGPADPAARWQIALAMLRQWYAGRTPEHDLVRIKPEYFVEDAPFITLAKSPAT